MSRSTLSDGQYSALFAIAFTSCTLSLVGSATIIHICRRKIKTHLLSRIMFGLSFGDIVTTSALFLQPFLIPTNQDPVLRFARGNQTSCNALGTLMRFPASVAAYNCFLSVYFLCTVRFNWKPNESGSFRKWEILGHTFALSIPIVFGIAGIVTDSFNLQALINICELGPLPTDCTVNKDLECIRGGEISLTLDWAYTGIQLVLTVIAICCTVSLYRYVRQQTIQSNRHAFAQQQQQQQESNNTAHRRRSSHQQHRTPMEDQSREVAVQAALYTLAYMNGLLWGLIYRIVYDMVDVSGRDSEPAFFCLAVLAYCFFPLQGFWNSCIYIRPRYLNWRRRHPEGSRLWAMKQVLSGEEPIARRASSFRFPVNRDQAARHLSFPFNLNLFARSSMGTSSEEAKRYSSGDRASSDDDGTNDGATGPTTKEDSFRDGSPLDLPLDLSGKISYDDLNDEDDEESGQKKSSNYDDQLDRATTNESNANMTSNRRRTVSWSDQSSMGSVSFGDSEDDLGGNA